MSSFSSCQSGCEFQSTPMMALFLTYVKVTSSPTCVPIRERRRATITRIDPFVMRSKIRVLHLSDSSFNKMITNTAMTIYYSIDSLVNAPVRLEFVDCLSLFPIHRSWRLHEIVSWENPTTWCTLVNLESVLQLSCLSFESFQWFPILIYRTE